MATASQMRMQTLRMLIVLGLLSVVCSPLPAFAQSPTASDHTQYESPLQYESQVIYLANLERAALGIPPLRWNRELTLAARAFSADLTLNRAVGYCGHVDSQGNRPGERILAHGFANAATWAENVLCGLASPEAAVGAWMRSDGHRAALLDPNFREVGVGYYQDADSERGYVAMDLGRDDGFAPVIINAEALQTTASTVNLYVYAPESNDSFQAMGPVHEMMISNQPTFDDGAVWEPYTPEKRWELEAGSGWRHVYVRLRDAFGNSVTASDTIYVGDSIEWDGVTLDAMATSIEKTVEIDHLPPGTMPQAQFRLNWLVDDAQPLFKLVYGDGGPVVDRAANGGTSQRMNGDGFEASAVLRTYKFIHETPLVAYLRLKVADHTAADTLVEVTVNGGGVTYGPLVVRATDFEGSNTYQEFALPFVFHANDQHPFLEIWMRTEGTTDVFFDGASFFSESVDVATPLAWTVPGGMYRGQSVWMRYADVAGHFSDIMEIDVAQANGPALLITPMPSEYYFEVIGDVVSPAEMAIQVACDACDDQNWSVNWDVSWIDVQAQNDQIILSVDAGSLAPSEYTTTVQILVPEAPEIDPVALSVDVVVLPPEPMDDRRVEVVQMPNHEVFLPWTARR